jgi:predicted secreted protein
VAEPEVLEAKGAAGEPIELPIGGGPPTGYGWELDLPAGVERIDDSPGEDAAPGTHLGGSRGGRVRVRAPAGEHVIVGRLVRPWERDQAERVVRIVLRVR